VRVEANLWSRAIAFIQQFANLQESLGKRKLLPKQHCGDTCETEILNTSSEGNIQFSFSSLIFIVQTQSY